jgi:DNA segregation ATPase FtsK/SpoIIIE-like protein
MMNSTTTSALEKRGKEDPLYDKAVLIVRAHKRVSISLVQRHLMIGYNRAALMLEAMEGTVIDRFSPDGNVLPEPTVTAADAPGARQ